MKYKSYLFYLIAFIALAGTFALVHTATEKAAGSAHAAVYDTKFTFNKGIGFYALSGGQLVWLDYPLFEHDRLKEDALPVSKGDFRLFSYGIDYARNPAGLPPHLTDFAVVFHDTPYNIDSPDFLARNVEERRGPYAVHFLPIMGYDQPVYEITCDIWNALRQKGAPPVVWGFKIKDPGTGSVPSVFWFSFKDLDQPQQ